MRFDTFIRLKRGEKLIRICFSMSIQEQHEDLIKQIKIFCHTRFKAEGDGVLGTQATAPRLYMDPLIQWSLFRS